MNSLTVYVIGESHSVPPLSNIYCDV